MQLTAEEQDARWVDHFKEILNQPEPTTKFNLADEANASPVVIEIGESTIKETVNAVKALRNSKAAGMDEITGEMLKHGGKSMTAG